MRFLGLAAIALALTASAYADSVSEACTPFSASDGDAYFTSSSGVIASGTSTCAAFSNLPNGATFENIEIVLETDYTGGVGLTLNTIQTVFSISLSDTLTATSAPGVGPAETYTSINGAPNDPTLGINYFDEISTLTLGEAQAGFSEGYSTTVTAGSVQGVSGQIYAIENYSSATPEPGSMMLMGSGLLAFAFVGRKLARKAR